MREIKFRAWNWEEMQPAISIWCILTQKWVESYEDFIFMQYTWLKDKNGKEIYEDDFTDEWRVVFNEEYLWFFVEIDKENKEYRPLYDIVWLEVIWNIYENPELLSN